MNKQMVAERICYYRKIRGYSQEQLAEKLMTTQCVISCTENAKTGSWIDSLSKLSIIANALEIDLQTMIFGGTMHMKNYKNIPMKRINTDPEIYSFDDLIIIVSKPFGYNFISDECEDEPLIKEFCLTALIGNTVVGKINGLYTTVYGMFTVPEDILCQLDSESAIYGDEVLAYLDRVLPQVTIELDNLEHGNLSDEEINIICEKMKCKKNEAADKVEEDADYYISSYVVFFDDVLINPDYREHGIFSNMMKVCEYIFGDDYSGAAYIYPVKTDDEGCVVDDEYNAEENLHRNKRIAEKFGWVLTDDFSVSSTNINAYALRLPEHILDIASIGEEFRKYVLRKDGIS